MDIRTNKNNFSIAHFIPLTSKSFGFKVSISVRWLKLICWSILRFQAFQTAIAIFACKWEPKLTAVNSLQRTNRTAYFVFSTNTKTYYALLKENLIFKPHSLIRLSDEYILLNQRCKICMYIICGNTIYVYNPMYT